jgi:hypothetical protein
MLQSIDCIDFSTHVVFLGFGEEVLDGRMFVISSKHLRGLLLSVSQILASFHHQSWSSWLVWFVYVVNREDSKVPVVSGISKSHSCALSQPQVLDGGLGDIEAYRHAEEVSVCKTEVFDDPAGV